MQRVLEAAFVSINTIADIKLEIIRYFQQVLCLY